jgi:hypothetical protein
MKRTPDAKEIGKGVDAFHMATDVHHAPHENTSCIREISQKRTFRSMLGRVTAGNLLALSR